MRRTLLAITLLLVICSEFLGNTGVFLGSGHSIQLAKSADVRMVSEDVTITPVCGIDTSRHSVEFRCIFILKNLSDKPVKIQVGFPLDREPRLIKGNDTDLVLSTHFIARDANQTYHIRHVTGDSQNKYGHIFLWDMEFVAGETKELHVGYLLPMSYGAYTTHKVEDADNIKYPPHYEKSWHARVEACMVTYFSYITETGQSWAGPIDKATFRVENNVFEHDLKKFPEYLGGNPADLPAGTEIPDNDPDFADVGSMAQLGFVFGMKLGTVYSHISPEGWKSAYIPEIPSNEPKPEYEPDGITWIFENYKPGPPLTFKYYLVGFPETVADCNPWVRQVLGKTPKKEDIRELREIVAAFFGVAPQTAPVKRLVEKQIWYNPQCKVKETDLSEQRRAVLDRLKAIAND